MAVENVLAVILAGGRGERLSVLAQERSKPAMPFAGKYRIIDFTLSNCVNSGMYNVAVLTQYQPLSLSEHIGVGAAWGFATPDRTVRLFQPYLTRDEKRDWYKGTADAVYQNLHYIEQQSQEMVLILSGDHVYKMDYSWMLQFHEERQADVTLAYTRLPEEDLQHFGTVIIDEERRVIGFEEKVRKPKSSLVSMGIYLFRKEFLKQCLEEDTASENSSHDFGRDILPKMVGKNRIFGYDFQGYWRDVGTVQAYWQANMDMIDMSPGGYLSDPGWPIHTSDVDGPPATISGVANVGNSMISNGCIIEGNVEHSILSPGVIVAEGAVVRNSIIMSETSVGSHSIIDYSILDKEVVVEAGCHLGFGDDLRANRWEPSVLNTGITIVGKRARIPPGTRIGRNCIICADVQEDCFRRDEVKSGGIVRLKRNRGS
ncbi:MAG: glucose-1-phosphate adenylyltransferase [Dehalococcoidales bacterium]|nr:glucose-1-phosphate adenylyltransferase [Dehalococcoidales bacterium]